MANKRAKKQTLAEFRAWLAGVEELQPETWCPDATQWVLIRNKINNITEPKPSSGTDEQTLQKLVEAMSGTSQPSAAPHGSNVGNPYPTAQQVAHIPPPPPPTGGVPQGPVEIAPQAAAYSGPAIPAPAIDLPDVAKPRDTGDGNYSSGFV